VTRIESSHRFDVPVEQGFAFITNTGNSPSFWPGYVRLEPESSWGAPGDTACLVTRILGRERKLVLTVTGVRAEPARHVHEHATRPSRCAPRAPLRARRRWIRLPAGRRIRAAERDQGCPRPNPSATRDQTRICEHLRRARPRARTSDLDRRHRRLGGRPSAADHGHPPRGCYTPAGTPASATVTVAHVVTVETFWSA
jgi:hypothetical protein